MPPCPTRGRARPQLRARGVGRARGEHEKGDCENHQESIIGGRANALKGNILSVKGAPPAAFGDAKFMQGMFTVIEQVVGTQCRRCKCL